MKELEKEYEDNFKNTIGDYAYNKIKPFIQAQIDKARKEEKLRTIEKLLYGIENYIIESGKDFGLENIEVAREYHNLDGSNEQLKAKYKVGE